MWWEHMGNDWVSRQVGPERSGVRLDVLSFDTGRSGLELQSRGWSACADHDNCGGGWKKGRGRRRASSGRRLHGVVPIRLVLVSALNGAVALLEFLA